MSVSLYFRYTMAPTGRQIHARHQNRPKLFNRKLKRETASNLAHLARAEDRKQVQLSNEIADLAGTNQPTICFGTTTPGQEIMLSMETAATHGLVLGASGAGKSFVARLSFLKCSGRPLALPRCRLEF